MLAVNTIHQQNTEVANAWLWTVRRPSGTLQQGLKVILSGGKAQQSCDPVLALLTFHKHYLRYTNTQLMFRMTFLNE